VVGPENPMPPTLGSSSGTATALRGGASNATAAAAAA